MPELFIAHVTSWQLRWYKVSNRKRDLRTRSNLEGTRGLLCTNYLRGNLCCMTCLCKMCKASDICHTWLTAWQPANQQLTSSRLLLHGREGGTEEGAGGVTSRCALGLARMTEWHQSHCVRFTGEGNGFEWKSGVWLFFPLELFVGQPLSSMQLIEKIQLVNKVKCNENENLNITLPERRHEGEIVNVGAQRSSYGNLMLAKALNPLLNLILSK